MLPDGRYDAFVIDAEAGEPGPDAPDHGTAMRLELTIIAGDHKGEVVSVTATGLEGSEIDLVGMPATLVVDQGRPVVTIDA